MAKWPTNARRCLLHVSALSWQQQCHVTKQITHLWRAIDHAHFQGSAPRSVGGVHKKASILSRSLDRPVELISPFPVLFGSQALGTGSNRSSILCFFLIPLSYDLSFFVVQDICDLSCRLFSHNVGMTGIDVKSAAPAVSSTRVRSDVPLGGC